MQRIVLGLFHAEVLTVGASPVPLIGSVGGDRPTIPRLTLTFSPSVSVSVGGPGVTVGSGFVIPAGSQFSLDCDGGLFAVSGSTSSVSILEGF